MGESSGILKVRVVKGTRLAVRDFRTSDPYVVLRLGNQVVKTRVINSNLNPVWDEELSFTITSPPPRLLKLVISLYLCSLCIDFSVLCEVLHSHFPQAVMLKVNENLTHHCRFVLFSPPVSILNPLSQTNDQPPCRQTPVVGSLPGYPWDPKGHRLTPKGHTSAILGNEAKKELPIWTSRAAAGMVVPKGQPEAVGHACDHRAVELEIAVTAGMPVMQDLLGSVRLLTRYHLSIKASNKSPCEVWDSGNNMKQQSRVERKQKMTPMVNSPLHAAAIIELWRGWVRQPFIQGDCPLQNFQDASYWAN